MPLQIRMTLQASDELDYSPQRLCQGWGTGSKGTCSPSMGHFDCWAGLLVCQSLGVMFKALGENGELSAFGCPLAFFWCAPVDFLTAFDTVDHGFFVERLLGVGGIALLTGRPLREFCTTLWNLQC